MNSGRVTYNFEWAISARVALLWAGFSLPAQPPFFLNCTGGSTDTDYRPCAMPRPVTDSVLIIYRC